MLVKRHISNVMSNIVNISTEPAEVPAKVARRSASPSIKTGKTRHTTLLHSGLTRDHKPVSLHMSLPSFQSPMQDPS